MKHGIHHIGNSGVAFAFCRESWDRLPHSTATKKPADVDCPDCLKTMQRIEKDIGYKYISEYEGE